MVTHMEDMAMAEAGVVATVMEGVQLVSGIFLGSLSKPKINPLK